MHYNNSPPYFRNWYIRRIHNLLGITVPRTYARRFYNTLLSHQAMLRKNEQREVSLEEAAQDWYTRYHLPAIYSYGAILPAIKTP